MPGTAGVHGVRSRRYPPVRMLSTVVAIEYGACADSLRTGLAWRVRSSPQGAGLGVRCRRYTTSSPTRSGGAAVRERVEINARLAALWGHSSSSRKESVTGYSLGSMPAYDRKALSASPYRRSFVPAPRGAICVDCGAGWCRGRRSRCPRGTRSRPCVGRLRLPPRRARPARLNEVDDHARDNFLCSDFCMEVNWLAERSSSLRRSHRGVTGAGKRGDGICCFRRQVERGMPAAFDAGVHFDGSLSSARAATHR